MLWWLVDNANLVLLILLLVAFGFGVHFWLTRRGASLLGLGGVIALMGLVWVLSLLVVTDRKRLVLAVEDVAARINKQDWPGAFSHFADNVQLDLDGTKMPMTREAMQKMAEGQLKHWRIPGIVIWNVEVGELEGPKAVVTFYVRPQDGGGEYARGEARCVLTGTGKWQVNALKIQTPGSRGAGLAAP